MIATKSKRFGLLACATAPLVVLTALRTVVPGAGPLSALAAKPAATDSADDPTAAPRDISVDPKVLEALKQLESSPLGPSPLIASPVHTAGAEAPASVYVPAAAGGFVREFTLTSIVGGRTPVAVIDGQLRKVGDDLGSGWTVKSIESTTKDVVIAGPDNTTKTLTLRR